MIKNKIKLNALQNKTLALFQELAKSPETSMQLEDSSEVAIMFIPKPHGNHVHIGRYVVSAKDASGFTNEKVWQALARKGLARSEFPSRIILTQMGLDYDTGFSDDLEESDH